MRHILISCVIAAGACGLVTSHASAAVLVDQAAAPVGGSIISQDFAAPDVYDVEVADDFTVPAGQRWRIDSAQVIGSGGSAPSVVRVTVYADAGGLPGAELFSQDVSATPPSYVANLSGAPTLDQATYWISFRAVGGSYPGGTWGWRQTGVLHGAVPVYRNPGGGFANGCSTFGSLATCIGPSFARDMQLTLVGEPAVPYPTGFTIGAAVLDRKRGSATVSVDVQAPGTLSLASGAVTGAQVVSNGPSTLQIPVDPVGKARKKLRRKGKLTVTGTLTFAPTIGSPASQVLEVKLKRKRKHRH